MLWMILIATIGRRRAKLEALLVNLLPQIEPYGGLVAVRALWNNGERPLADVRQRLVQQAITEQALYLSFVDDDDRPADFYVDEVVKATGWVPVGVSWRGDRPDYIGWRMQHYADGIPSKPTYHSLRYDRWSEDDAGYYRDISHLNPIRTRIAAVADFRLTNPPEDVAWSDQIRAWRGERGQPMREAYVPDDLIMYHYYATGDSTWHPGSVRDEGHERLVVDHPNFAYIDWKD